MASHPVGGQRGRTSSGPGGSSISRKSSQHGSLGIPKHVGLKQGIRQPKVASTEPEGQFIETGRS